MNTATIPQQGIKDLVSYIPRFLIALSMFTMGACGLVYEYVFATQSSFLLGNSITQFAIIFGVMMFSMGLGSSISKHFSDSNLFDKFIVVEILLGLVGAFGPTIIFFSFSLEHFDLIQYFFIISVGMFIGMEIPILTRINKRYSSALRVNIAQILAADYYGSLAGALLWVYILLGRFDLLQIPYILGFVNTCVAILSLVYFWRFITFKKTIVAISFLAIAAVIFGYFSAIDWKKHGEQNLYDDRITHAITTRYQRIVITEEPLDRQTTQLCFYINGNTQFCSSDEHLYHDNLIHPAMALAKNQRRNILILGGGDGLALREVLKYDDVKSVTLVDLDPGMVKVASTYPSLVALNNNAFADARVMVKDASVKPGKSKWVLQEKGERKVKGNKKPKYAQTYQKVAKVHVMNIDADLFIRDTHERYDVIFVDFPDPNSHELAKLYSVRFYKRLRSKLSNHGFVAVQSTSPYHAKEAYLCILRTMRKAGFNILPYHDNVPSFGEWGWVLAWRMNISEKEMRRRIKSWDSSSSMFDVPTRYLTPRRFYANTIFAVESLKARSKSVNTLHNHAVVDLYMDGWQTD